MEFQDLKHGLLHCVPKVAILAVASISLCDCALYNHRKREKKNPRTMYVSNIDM